MSIGFGSGGRLRSWGGCRRRDCLWSIEEVAFAERALLGSGGLLKGYCLLRFDTAGESLAYGF